MPACPRTHTCALSDSDLARRAQYSLVVGGRRSTVAVATRRPACVCMCDCAIVRSRDRVCACMGACACVCMRVHACACVRMCAHACACVRMRVHACACVHVRTFTVLGCILGNATCRSTLVMPTIVLTFSCVLAHVCKQVYARVYQAMPHRACWPRAHQSSAAVLRD